ncbi:response regulator transcription factor [Actinomadura rupiterrae]|uniref:response regulator transcription factor n=1 Tax=Actinomadura rupiterrae TaxID=559627 RepID=UPI0020A5A2A3|nr:response regulator transcription factor [Actinomadura rupiterrae]MCP2342305.1 DNA-binding response OmpR family regulator [Actinomadura rupiterrae]
MRVLLVEDDLRLTAALSTHLRRGGYEVRHARTAADGVRMAADADFVLLDLGLPDCDGLKALEQVRRVSTVPLIVVTARAGDVLKGLHRGADDYLVKPVRPDELLARMQAVVRRGARPARGQRVTAGDVVVDVPARRVTVAGRDVPLSRREFDVLAVLASRPGEVCAREEILLALWGDTSMSASRALNVHVRNIRGKTDRSWLVVTLVGTGYRLGDGPP